MQGDRKVKGALSHSGLAGSQTPLARKLARPP